MSLNLPITITDKLSPDRWREYRDLRLVAVQTRPEAFLDTEEETLAAPDSLWQERLEASLKGDDSAVLFAINTKNELVGITAVIFNQKQKIKHSAHIVSVFVKPEYQGQGIGRQLLQAAIARARQNPDVEILRLEVMTTNTPAYNLYQSLGFKNVGINGAAIKIDDTFYDDYQMELWLSKS
jgi:ribosomal protein S18 acetylase RimI-like enzyme